MNAATEALIKSLFQVATDLYRARGEWKPELSAQFYVTDTLKMYKDTGYLEQLLAQTIEDCNKALAAAQA